MKDTELQLLERIAEGIEQIPAAIDNLESSIQDLHSELGNITTAISEKDIPDQTSELLDIEKSIREVAGTLDHMGRSMVKT